MLSQVCPLHDPAAPSMSSLGPPLWTLWATEHPLCPSPGRGKKQPLDFCNCNHCGCASVPRVPRLLPTALHLIKATSSCRLATMSPSGLLRGACRTTLISLLLVCCLLPPGEASQPGEGWSWGIRGGWGNGEGKASHILAAATLP